MSKGKRHGGASTIDMQLFRTITQRYERTISRKLFEIFGAILLQRHYTKLEILRIYLSVAYFGTLLRGSSAASYAMFGENAEGLTGHNAAVLASLLVYPKPSVPTANWNAKIKRRANYAQAISPLLKQKYK